VNTEFDIVILGGGLVGSSLACALDGRGYRIALVEGSLPRQSPPGFDERKLALAAASLTALGNLGVLAHLPEPPSPIRRIHVSRQGDFGVVRLQASEVGRDAFGGVVSRSSSNWPDCPTCSCCARIPCQRSRLSIPASACACATGRRR